MGFEALPIPALFVYGGTFADYVKEKRKFSRFSTLASFSGATTDCSSERSTCDEDEQGQQESELRRLYRDARKQDIGTVRTIEMPEFTTKVVNLVDVVRFIQMARGDWVSDEDGAEEEEEQQCEEDDAYDEEEENVIDKQCLSNMFSKVELDVSKPIVYAGTFEDYKKDSRKFERFRTIQACSSALCDTSSTVMSCARQVDAEEKQASAIDAACSMSSTFEYATEVDSSMNDKEPLIFDSHISDPFTACQLVALATPPSLAAEMSMYMALSNVSLKTLSSSTMAGAKAAMKRVVADLDKVTSDQEEQSESLQAQVPFEQEIACRQNAYRFKFAAHQLEAIESKNPGAALLFKDDGSNWLVDHALPGSSYAHQRRRGHSSASSWGGGSTTLEPIAHGKVSLAHDVSFTLPKLPAAYSQDASVSERREFGLLHAGSIF